MTVAGLQNTVDARCCATCHFLWGPWPHRLLHCWCFTHCNAVCMDEVVGKEAKVDV
jgi:hypothetical protein